MPAATASERDHPGLRERRATLNPPLPLPGGEPATGADDEAPLQGGAGGGFMERENLQKSDANRRHEPIHWWGETPSSPDILIGKNIRVRRSLTPPRFMERVDRVGQRVKKRRG